MPEQSHKQFRVRILLRLAAIAIAVAWVGCSPSQPRARTPIPDAVYAAPIPPRYRTVTPAPRTQTFDGKASYYADPFHGRKTASGEVFNMHALTAAHKTLPFGTIVQVTNLRNKRSITVRINDRGPFIEGRCIDLSLAAAKELGMIEAGVVEVRVRVTSVVVASR